MIHVETAGSAVTSIETIGLNSSLYLKVKEAVENGDIYKSSYRGFYCYGCEEFKTEKDLVDGKCSEHGMEPELIKEESYVRGKLKYDELVEELAKLSRVMWVSSDVMGEILRRAKEVRR